MRLHQPYTVAAPDTFTIPPLAGALCAGDAPKWDQNPAPRSAEHVQDAARVCQKCPVRQRCLAEALRDESLEGVWGGMHFGPSACGSSKRRVMVNPLSVPDPPLPTQSRTETPDFLERLRRLHSTGLLNERDIANHLEVSLARVRAALPKAIA
jgi:hypothetical protein